MERSALIPSASAEDALVPTPAPTLDYRPAGAVQPLPALWLIPSDLTDPEPRWKRWMFLALALAITCGYFYFLTSYWMPAHPGVDQNGYLVGGKQLALTGSSGIKQDNPFQYVGAMWVLASDPEKDGAAWFYPKYPIGLPLLDAIPLWINWNHGKAWALYVSPLGATMALLGMFLLLRALAGSFIGIMAMLLLGMNVTTLGLANNPNSHAPALAFVVWGMFMMIRWWQTGSIWRGLLAGFLLGYTATIRYSEGLLLLPLLVAVLSALQYREIIRVSWWRVLACVLIAAGATWLRIRVENKNALLVAIAAAMMTVGVLVPWWRLSFAPKSRAFWHGAIAVALVFAVIALRQPLAFGDSYERNALYILGLTFAGLILFIYSPASWRRAAVPLIGWAIPVLWLVGFNWFAMGSITGYDTTNESTGFTWEEFQRKWEFTVYELYLYGAFLLIPLTLIGLAVMWRWNWRVALAMLLWLIPGTALYASYYWGMDLVGLSYLRFFLTLIPAMILPAVWLLRHGGWFAGDNLQRSRGSIAMPIAAGILVSLCSIIALRASLPAMERELSVNANLWFTCETIAQNVPKDSIVFADQRGGGMSGLLNFIQWRGDYDLYAADAFNSGGGRFVARFGGGGGRRGGMGGLGGSFAGDQPSPRQTARRDYLRDAVYNNLSDQELVWAQNALIRNALAEQPKPRRVFVIVPLNTIQPFRSRYLNSGEFETKQVTKWTEPAAAVPEPTTTMLMLPQRGFGPNRGPVSWQIFEIVSKVSKAPPPQPPASAPVAQR